jgi:hypothetical protein
MGKTKKEKTCKAGIVFNSFLKTFNDSSLAPSRVGFSRVFFHIFGLKSEIEVQAHFTFASQKILWWMEIVLNIF